MTGYTEYSPAAEYLHLLSAPMWTAAAERLTAVLGQGDPGPDAGVVVEFGAGTGLGTEVLLNHFASAPIVAAEPSPHLRAVLLARLRDLPGGERVTVFPCSAQQLVLPDRIVAAVGMHMIGHLGPDARHELFGKLVPRLAPGAVLVFNVQPPESPEPMEVPPFVVEQGRLRYEGSGRAVPVGADRLRWTMTYRTLQGADEIGRAVADYDWWIVTAAGLAEEITAAGAHAEVDADLVIARIPH